MGDSMGGASDVTDFRPRHMGRRGLCHSGCASVNLCTWNVVGTPYTCGCALCQQPRTMSAAAHLWLCACVGNSGWRRLVARRMRHVSLLPLVKPRWPPFINIALLLS